MSRKYEYCTLLLLPWPLHKERILGTISETDVLETFKGRCGFYASFLPLPGILPVMFPGIITWSLPPESDMDRR